jgi:hypothetical protein
MLILKMMQLKEIYEKIYSKQDNSPHHENILRLCEHCCIVVSCLSSEEFGLVTAFVDARNSKVICITKHGIHIEDPEFYYAQGSLFEAMVAIAKCRTDSFIELTDTLIDEAVGEIHAFIKHACKEYDLELIVFKEDKSYVGFEDKITKRVYNTYLECKDLESDTISLWGLFEMGVPAYRVKEALEYVIREELVHRVASV